MIDFSKVGNVISTNETNESGEDIPSVTNDQLRGTVSVAVLATAIAASKFTRKNVAAGKEPIVGLIG